jgi:WD40 repeat protein
LPADGPYHLRSTFSPDGHYLAQADASGVIHVWDTGTWQVVRRFPRADVSGLAYSPDGRRLAASLSDGTVRVLDTDSGKELQQLRTAGPAASWLAFHPDGRRVLTARHRQGSDSPVRPGRAPGGETIQIWDLESAQHARVIPGLRQGPYGPTLCYHPDGRRVASASAAGPVTLWDAATGHVEQTFVGHKGTVFDVAVSPNGQLLAAAAHGGACVWDVRTGRVVGTVPAPNIGGFAGRVAFSPDSGRVALADNSGMVMLNAATAQTLFAVKNQFMHWFSDLAFSPDGSKIISLLYPDKQLSSAIQVRDAATGDETASFPLAGRKLYTVRWFRDGKRFVTVGTGGKAVIQTTDGREERTFAGHAGAVYGVAISPDEKRLATASADGSVRIWDIASGDELLRLTGQRRAFWSVAFSPDGRQLAATSSDGTLRIWDATPVADAAPPPAVEDADPP